MDAIISRQEQPEGAPYPALEAKLPEVAPDVHKMSSQRQPEALEVILLAAEAAVDARADYL